MAKGVTAGANQSGVVDKAMPKRRARGKIPLKPKGILFPTVIPTENRGRAQAKNVQTGISAFSSIPRAIRTRIERAAERRPGRKSKKGQEETQEVKNQPEARNSSTGKVALGPWSGAFGSGSISDEDVNVLYLDRSGSAHLELDDDAVMAENARPVINVRRSAEIIAPPSPRGMKIHTLEVSKLQDKPKAKMTAALPMKGKRGHAANRIGQINQPRRGF